MVDTTTQQSVLILTLWWGLADLLARGEERDELIKMAGSLQSIVLSARSVCDLELLATERSHRLTASWVALTTPQVLKEMRLAGGTLFPIPITLAGRRRRRHRC